MVRAEAAGLPCRGAVAPLMRRRPGRAVGNSPPGDRCPGCSPDERLELCEQLCSTSCRDFRQAFVVPLNLTANVTWVKEVCETHRPFRSLAGKHRGPGMMGKHARQGQAGSTHLAGNVSASVAVAAPKLSSRMGCCRLRQPSRLNPGDAMTPPRRPRGLFHEITEGIYWFLVVDVLLVLASAPTLLLWTMLGTGWLTALWFMLAALPMLPAVAAGLYACRAWREDRELIPARHFLRGYRLNALDSLKVGAPLLLVLGVLGVNLTQGGSAGAGALGAVFLVLGAVALLLLVRVLSIVSSFSFRSIDIFRLAAFTLLMGRWRPWPCSHWGCWPWGSSWWSESSCSWSRRRCWRSRCGPRSGRSLSCSRSSSSLLRRTTGQTQLLLSPAPRDSHLARVPREREPVLAHAALEGHDAVIVGAQGPVLHPPFAADQLLERVVARLGRPVGAHQPRRGTEPGSGIAHPPVGQGLDRGLCEHGVVVPRELIGLTRLALGRGRPGVDDVIVEVDDVGRHQITRHQRGLGQLDRQAETGETADDLGDLLLAAIALVHVRLQPDGIDPDARVQAFLDDLLERRGEIEVVQDQPCCRVRRSGGLEDHADDVSSSPCLGQAGHGVVLGPEHRQDDGLVDRVPLLDQPGEIRGLTGDPMTDVLDDLRLALVEQRRRRERVPQQRVALDADAVLHQSLRQVAQPLRVRGPRRRFEPSPVERQCGHVEQVEPQPGVLIGLLGAQLEGRAPETEVVTGLFDADGLPGQGRAVLVDDPEPEGLDPFGEHVRSQSVAHQTLPPVAAATPAPDA